MIYSQMTVHFFTFNRYEVALFFYGNNISKNMEMTDFKPILKNLHTL